MRVTFNHKSDIFLDGKLDEIMVSMTIAENDD